MRSEPKLNMRWITDNSGEDVMLIKILIIVVIVTVGFFIASTGIGEGNTLFTFLAAFGLFMIIAFAGFIMFAKKQQKRQK